MPVFCNVSQITVFCISTQCFQQISLPEQNPKPTQIPSTPSQQYQTNKQTKKSNSKRCLSGVFLTTLLYKEKIGKTLCYLRHLRFGVTDKERHVVDFILYHKVLFFPFEILEIYRRSQLEAFIRVCYLNIPQIKIQFNPQVKTRAVKMNR